MTGADIPRARLRNQQISRAALDRPAAVVAWFGALQAQDYLGALWAIGLRLPDSTEAGVEESVRTGAIIRTWPLRGTLHFVAAPDSRWVLDLLRPRNLARSATRLRQLEIDDAVLDRSARLLVRALEGGKHLLRGELFRVLEAAGLSTGGQRGLYILWRLAQEGLICYGPRRGKQQTFALLEEWAPGAKTLPGDEALAELARRYFTSHGPATLADFVWWSGLAAPDARAAVEMAGALVAREFIDGKTYWMSPDSHPPSKETTPAPAYLLPAFDEYLVGYRDRGAVLDSADARRLNAGGGLLNPAIVVGGRVTGVWKRTFTRGGVVFSPRFFVEPNASIRTATAQAAERYARFIDKPLVASRD